MKITLLHEGEEPVDEDLILKDTPNPIKSQSYDTEKTEVVQMNPGFADLYQLSKQ